MVILALDVGEKRIGVATTDELEMLATPREVLHRRSRQQALDAIVALVERFAAELVVVGLPVSFDGQLHGQARAVQRFGEALRARLAVPVIYSDESLSSVRAEERLRAVGIRAEKIRQRIDSEAAAVILEDYLRERTPIIPQWEPSHDSTSSAAGNRPVREGPAASE